MIQKKKNTTRYFQIFVCITVAFILGPTSFTNADDVSSSNLKIAMMKMDTDHGFQRNMMLQSISIHIIDDISSFDHVDEVIPVITMTYRDFPANGSFPNQGSPPNPNNIPSASPDSFPEGGRVNKKVDYIVEGIQITEFESYITSILSITLESGTYPSSNDTYEVIIGKSAQDYFDSDLYETIIIEETEFTVSGIFDDETYNNYVFMRISTGQSLYRMESNEINTIYIYADDSSSVEDLYNSLTEAYPSYQIRSEEFSSFDFPSNSLSPDEGKTSENIENSTPDFELVSLMFIVCLFIIRRKLKKGDHP